MYIVRPHFFGSSAGSVSLRRVHNTNVLHRVSRSYTRKHYCLVCLHPYKLHPFSTLCTCSIFQRVFITRAFSRVCLFAKILKATRAQN